MTNYWKIDPDGECSKISLAATKLGSLRPEGRKGNQICSLTLVGNLHHLRSSYANFFEAASSWWWRAAPITELRFLFQTELFLFWNAHLGTRPRVPPVAAGGGTSKERSRRQQRRSWLHRSRSTGRSIAEETHQPTPDVVMRGKDRRWNWLDKIPLRPSTSVERAATAKNIPFLPSFPMYILGVQIPTKYDRTFAMSLGMWWRWSRSEYSHNCLPTICCWELTLHLILHQPPI